MPRLVVILIFSLAGCSESTPPEPQADRLTLKPESVALAIGEEVLIQASTVPVTPVIRFGVKNTEVATIDDRGIVTARNFGLTFVVAEAGLIRDSTIIAVPLPIVALSPDSIRIRPGGQAYVLHSHKYGSTPHVLSRDPTVARIAIDQMAPKLGRWIVTGVIPGTTYIVAASSNGSLTVRDSTRVIVSP